MVHIEIKSKTYGKIIINGHEQIVYPDSVVKTTTKDEDVLQIEIDERDIFRQERIEYHNKQQKLFEYDY